MTKYEIAQVSRLEAAHDLWESGHDSDNDTRSGTEQALEDRQPIG